MKVILLKDVARLGRRSEEVNVPDGYALNQLIPKKLAEPATAINRKRLEQDKHLVAVGVATELANFVAAKTSLGVINVTVPVEANEKGHLFRAVKADEVVAVLAGQGVTVPAHMLEISAPIKTLGEHSITLVQGDNRHEFSITVVAK